MESASRTASRAVALTLTVALGLPLAASAGGRGEASRVRRPEEASRPVAGPLAQLWAWLAVRWGKDGILIDPDGARLSETSTVAGVSAGGITPTTDGTLPEPPL